MNSLILWIILWKEVIAIVDSGASTLCIHQIVAAAAVEFPGAAVVLVVDAAARVLRQGLTG